MGICHGLPRGDDEGGLHLVRAGVQVVGAPVVISIVVVHAAVDGGDPVVLESEELVVHGEEGVFDRHPLRVFHHLRADEDPVGIHGGKGESPRIRSAGVAHRGFGRGLRRDLRSRRRLLRHLGRFLGVRSRRLCRFFGIHRLLRRFDSLIALRELRRGFAVRRLLCRSLCLERLAVFGRDCGLLRRLRLGDRPRVLRREGQGCVGQQHGDDQAQHQYPAKQASLLLPHSPS